MRVHARFKLYDDARAQGYSGSGYVEAARVKLSAVQGEPFGSATPSGNIEMLIVNPDAFKMFHEAKIGQEFDVFFSPVEESK